MERVFFLLAVVPCDVPLARLLAEVPRLDVDDLLADLFASIGPPDAERAVDDRAPLVEPRAEFRAGDLVPARVFFALLRDLEDFFVRAAMTVSSRE